MKINNTTLIIGAIVVVGGFLWYRNRRKNENNETDSSSGGGASAGTNNSGLNQAISKPIKPINFNLKPIKIVDNTIASMPTPKTSDAKDYSTIALSRLQNVNKHYFVGDID